MPRLHPSRPSCGARQHALTESGHDGWPGGRSLLQCDAKTVSVPRSVARCCLHPLSVSTTRPPWSRHHRLTRRQPSSTSPFPPPRGGPESLRTAA